MLLSIHWQAAVSGGGKRWICAARSVDALLGDLRWMPWKLRSLLGL